MNWSSEWNNSPAFIEKVNAAFDIEYGKKVTLSIPIEGEWPRTVEAIQVGQESAS